MVGTKQGFPSQGSTLSELSKVYKEMLTVPAAIRLLLSGAVAPWWSRSKLVLSYQYIYISHSRIFLRECVPGFFGLP